MNSLLIAQVIIKRMLRNKREFFILILLPIVIVASLSYLVEKMSNEKPDIGVVNLDHEIYSSRLISNIENQLDTVLIPLNEGRYSSQLEDSEFDSVILIPENFSKNIKNGLKSTTYVYSKNNSSTSQNLRIISNQYIQSLYKVSFAANAMDSVSKDSGDTIANTILDDIENNSISLETIRPNNNHIDYQSKLPTVGFILIFIMIFIFTTIETIIEDKRKLILARIYVSPLREWEIIVGNILGSLILGIIQLIPLTITLKYIFELSWSINILQIFMILLSFLFATIGIGIGISGWIKQTTNISLIISIVIVPTSILGGAFIPRTMLPDLLNKIGYLVPQKWVMDALEQVLQGNSFQTLFIPLLIILMFGITFATFGLKTIKPLEE